MLYTNILYRSTLLIAVLLLQGCVTHPSPKPKEHIAPVIKTKNSSPDVKTRTIYFKRDSYRLDAKAKAILDSVVKKLKSNPDSTISITGRASEEGGSGYNLVLSRSRASAASNYIINQNVAPHQIVKVNALGETQPVCSDDTEHCRELNRRVTIAPGSLASYNTKDYQLIDTQVKMLHLGRDKKEIKQELIALRKSKNSKYVINSGDIFNISIYGEPELSIKEGVVKPDGTLTVAMIGDVKVSGLSVNEAMDKISKKLHHFLQDAIVSLVPVKFKAQSYIILGKVNSPGNYPVQENTTLLDAIADAGGFSIGLFQSSTIELADLEHAFIRRGLKVLPVDFTELARKGNPLHDIPLEDGDYIYIPSSLNTEVYVLGEVPNPGYFGYQERLTLTQLISHAGGYKETANINQVAVIRDYIKNPSVYIIDLEKIIEGKSIDFMLKPYDIAFIPKSHVGDWKVFPDMVTPSFNALSNGYATYYLFRGVN